MAGPTGDNLRWAWPQSLIGEGDLGTFPVLRLRENEKSVQTRKKLSLRHGGEFLMGTLLPFLNKLL